MAHWLLRYALASDYLERLPDFRDAHLRLAWDAAGRGELVLGGAVGDPVEAALLLFTAREAAEAFAEADPYVREGLVEAWRVMPWATVAGAGAADPVHPDATPTG